MIKLIWLILAMTAQGPQVVQVHETPRFKDVAECTKFAEGMHSRMQDFARGMLRADWDVDIPVRFHCAVDGTPA